MRSFIRLATAACALSLATSTHGQTLSPTSMLKLEALPEGGRWAELMNSDSEIYFLQWPPLRDGPTITGVMYKAFAKAKLVGDAHVTDVIVARGVRCSSGTVADLGIVGFDKDGKRVAAFPAAGGFQPATRGAGEGIFLEALCAPELRPADDALMSLAEAQEEADYYFIGQILERSGK